MKHYLITGGAGFIGSHLVDMLLGASAQVTVLDNFDPFYARAAKERNLSAARNHPGFRLLEVDISDSAALRQAAGPEYDAIIHLAAKAGVRPSIRDPLAYQKANVTGTQNLLEFAREFGVRQFVFASSSSVYGVNPHVPWSEDDHVLLPISPYASTKVSGELLGHVYSHLYGIRFLALRFFTVYGPRQRPDLAIHKFARLMLARRLLPVFGDGSMARDFTYIDDILSGIRAAIDYEESGYEIINLGNRRTITVLEMVHALETALGMAAKIDFQPEQPGDVPRTCASVDKARRLLGYEPRTVFLDGVRKFAAWLGCEEPTRPGSLPQAAAAAGGLAG